MAIAAHDYTHGQGEADFAHQTQVAHLHRGETAANRSCTPSGKYVVKRCKKLLARQVSIQNPLRQSRFSNVPMTAISYSAATQLRRCPAMPSKPNIIKGDLLYRPGLCKFIIACSMTRTVKGSHRNTVKNITLEHSHFWIALTHLKSYRSYITSDHSQQTRHQIYWQAQHFGRLAPSSKAMPLPNSDTNESFSPYIITSTVMALTTLWPWNSLCLTTLPFKVCLGREGGLTTSHLGLIWGGTFYLHHHFHCHGQKRTAREAPAQWRARKETRASSTARQDNGQRRESSQPQEIHKEAEQQKPELLPASW